MTDYLRSPVFQLKCLELLLGLVAIAFILGACYPSTDTIFLTQVVDFTLFGYSLLDLMIIGGFFLREPVSKLLILVVSLTGALFSLVSAVVLLVGWANQDTGRLLVATVASVLNTAVYAGDSYYIIRFAAD